MQLLNINTKDIRKTINFGKLHGSKLYFEFTEQEEPKGLLISINVTHNNVMFLDMFDIETGQKNKLLPQELLVNDNSCSFDYFNAKTISKLSQISLDNTCVSTQISMLFSDNSSVTFSSQDGRIIYERNSLRDFNN